MYSKKRKILAGICIPTAALVLASGISLLVINLNKPVAPVEHKDYVVTFDPGIGRFVSGQSNKTEVYANTTLDKVDQPVVEATGQEFAGWYDENDKPVVGQQLINRDMHLTAKYSSLGTGEHVLVTFTTGSTGASLQGNIRIAVSKGYFFFMINRPSVTHPTKMFKNWIYADGEKAGDIVRENDILTENITLIPQLTDTVGLTWNGMGATKTRGAPTTYVEAGTRFGEINQPTFSNGDLIFDGWYKEESCTNRWGTYDSVSNNTTAYAKWITKPTSEYCSVSYVQKTGTEVVPIFAPASSQIISKTDPWGIVIKPEVSTSPADYKVDHWEYTTAEEPTASDWIVLTNDDTLNFDRVKIAPVFAKYAQRVEIGGTPRVITQTQGKFVSRVIGCESQDVTWDVYDDEACTVTSTKATISEGILSVGFVSELGNIVYVQATSVNDPNVKSAPFRVQIELPYIDNTNIWYHTDSNWYYIDLDQMCDRSSTQYIVTNLKTQETDVVNKANDFTRKLYIGWLNTALPDDFMYGFSGFNGEIDISNVNYILDSFMEGCSKFNQQLTFSTSLWRIGNNFMSGCYKFNNGGSTNALDFSSCIKLKSIGDKFLNNCYNFNQQIRLPDSDTLTKIGSSFLSNCLRFSSPLNIPSSVTSVGNSFMLNCVSFASTITVDALATAFNTDQNQICATSQYWDDPETTEVETYVSEIYNTGYSVAGANADQFKALFQTSGSGSIWRTVK